MARGKISEDGATFVNANGYHYTRVEGKWVATHHLVAQEKLGRTLRKDEFVSFADGQRNNLQPSNIIVKKRGQTSLRRRQAQLVSRIDDLCDELSDICSQLGADMPTFPRG